MRTDAPLDQRAEGSQPMSEPQTDDQPLMAPSPSLTALLDLCAHYMNDDDLALIHEAYQVAATAHAGIKRRSGEPFIEHTIAVAGILAELAMDAQGIAAALLHDTVEDTAITLDGLRERFGPVIAAIVDGVTKFDAVEAPRDSKDIRDSKSGEAVADMPASATDGAVDTQAARARKLREQAETVRKLFLAMVADPRIVLLKLADRLHNMRTMAAQTPGKREQKSRETIELYAPLAGRIGVHVFQSELEDLAFSFLMPAEYARIVKRLREEETKRLRWAERMRERMAHELLASGIPAAVNWRVKRPYRAYLETQETGMDIAQLHDVFAFRILVNTSEQCYAALGIIHQLWHPYLERIRDYIAGPKINGYRSLHTAVFALDGRLAQMHIRTHSMHIATQHGIATTWLDRAESGERGPVTSALWLAHLPEWVSQLGRWQDELRLSASDFLEALRGEVLEDQIFIFTPKGDVRELPQGATVLDLAYQIHTDIGGHATGAIIQRNTRQGVLTSREVGLDYVLRTGDVARILTSAEAMPRPEWLTIVATRTARERINRSLRSQQRASSGALPGEAPRPQPLKHPSGRLAQVQLARCCFPCPGDAILGVADRGSGVTVHRTCCRTLRMTLDRRLARGTTNAGTVQVRWDQLPAMPYRMAFAIYGQDHQGLMHQVSGCVAQLGLNVYRSVAIAHQDRYKAAILLTLDMLPTTRREQVMRRLRAVQGVTQVERDQRNGCENAPR
ncbi:MAG TPA: HD domain-containing protein [Ktedonobacterales bacterium]|nr:HD domain-containing protein [Ktedonobacterales bacterium]